MLAHAGLRLCSAGVALTKGLAPSSSARISLALLLAQGQEGPGAIGLRPPPQALGMDLGGMPRACFVKQAKITNANTRQSRIERVGIVTVAVVGTL